MMKTRKPVVRRFLMRNYQTISITLISIAILLVAGIVGWVVDAEKSFMVIHIYMMITAAVLTVLGFGLIWIYHE